MGLHREFSESFGLSCRSTFSLIGSLKFSFSYFDDIPGHKSFVMDLKYDANFNRVASTGGGSVQVWQLEEGDQIVLNLVMMDSLACTSSIITRNTTTHDCLPYWFTVRDHRCTLLGWWGECYGLYDGDSSGVSNIMSFGRPKSELYLSECYTVQPWKLKWSKQIQTRMYVSLVLCLNRPWSRYISGQSDVTGSQLAVANLHNGVDIYSIPSLNLVKSFSYSIKINALYKVCIANDGWVVAGGENSFARLYDMHRGELLQMIPHSDGEWILRWFYFLDRSFIHQNQRMSLCNLSPWAKISL